MIKAIAAPLLRLTGIRISEEQWKALFQFVRFAMVGVTNAAVSYTVNISTLFIIHKSGAEIGYDYVIGNTMAFLLSVLWSYYWNSRKVFHSEDKGFREHFATLLKTYISYAFTGIIVNNILSTFWIQIIGISKYIAPLLNIPVTMPINFFVMKKWAYRKRAGNQGGH